MRIGAFLCLAALVGAVGTASAAEPVRAVVRREVVDLRDLPARSRLSGVAVEIRAPVKADAPRPWLSIAINGFVAARAAMGPEGRILLHATVDEQLLSMRNLIEVAAYVPHCDTPSCRAAAASVRAVGALRQEHAVASADATFAQLATRYRAGMTILHEPGIPADLASHIHDALAPRSDPLSGAGGLVIISHRQPQDHAAPIRFDLGPVGLVRQDGPTVIAPKVLDDLTVVQVLRAGDHPVIWVRPGRHLPPRLDLDNGDVAIFGRNGPVIAYSSDSDTRTLHPAYGAGVDADGSRHAMRIWRGLLLACWIAASGGLWLIYRRLPGRAAPQGDPAWAA